MDKESQKLAMLMAKMLEDRRQIKELQDKAMDVVFDVNAQKPQMPNGKHVVIPKLNSYKANVAADNVNHPIHYTQGGIECIDALEAATVDKTGIEAVCVANVIKYLWRYEAKNGLEDVEKAQWYLTHLIKILKKGASNGRNNDCE